MKQLQHIEFVITNQFPVEPKYKWWNKYRWKLVKLLGGVDPNETVKITRIPIRANTFMEKLYKQKSYLFEMFYREPKELLIGASDYEEMMGDKNIMQMFSFDAEYGLNHRINGLKVTVIPWMKGIVIMP